MKRHKVREGEPMLPLFAAPRFNGVRRGVVGGRPFYVRPCLVNPGNARLDLSLLFASPGRYLSQLQVLRSCFPFDPFGVYWIEEKTGGRKGVASCIPLTESPEAAIKEGI